MNDVMKSLAKFKKLSDEFEAKAKKEGKTLNTYFVGSGAGIAKLNKKESNERS